MLDPVAIERAESEIDRFIEKRERNRSKEIEIEELWKSSERRHREKRRRENRAAWYGFHEHMRELHQGLAAEHERKALALLEEYGGPVPGEGSIVNG